MPNVPEYQSKIDKYKIGDEYGNYPSTGEVVENALNYARQNSSNFMAEYFQMCLKEVAGEEPHMQEAQASIIDDVGAYFEKIEKTGIDPRSKAFVTYNGLKNASGFEGLKVSDAVLQSLESGNELKNKSRRERAAAKPSAFKRARTDKSDPLPKEAMGGEALLKEFSAEYAQEEISSTRSTQALAGVDNQMDDSPKPPIPETISIRKPASSHAQGVREEREGSSVSKGRNS